VFLHMKYVNQDLNKQYLKKMAPPLGKTIISTCMSFTDSR
jgi:predicted membrane-bound dolichyl-phosphate-mannose-protein mannosyltransferase